MKKSDLKIFKNIPCLETERLYLSKMTLDDLSDVYEYASDPLVSKYLLWNPHESINDTLVYLRYLQSLYSKAKFYDWGIHLKESGKMIGTCGFTSLDPISNRGTVGYVLNTSYTNKGYASEALKRVVDFAFSVLMLDRLDARYIIENRASKRVLEKCGFIYGGTEQKRMLVKGEYKTIGYSFKLNIDAY